MTDTSNTQAADGVPTYLGSGDPGGRFADYYPAWVVRRALRRQRFIEDYTAAVRGQPLGRST